MKEKHPLEIVPGPQRDYQTRPKIMFAGVSPRFPTGYGRVYKELLSRLNKKGWNIPLFSFLDTDCACYEMILKDSPPLKVHAGTKNQYEIFDRMAHVIKSHAIDYTLFLFDLWHFAITPQGCSMFQSVPHIIPYIPIDSPLNKFSGERYAALFAHTRHPVVFSNFAQKELEDYDVVSTMIPHGVDTKKYIPVSPEDKRALRKKHGFPPNCFLAGFVGQNSSDRKQIPRLMEIFTDWIRTSEIKDAYLYLHTEPTHMIPGSAFGIDFLSHALGAAGKIITPESGKGSVDEQTLIEYYQCMDVYVTASAAEGCGLPILEAQSCGVPCIVPANSAQDEWVAYGRIVPCDDWYISLVNGSHNRWGLVHRNVFANELDYYYKNSAPRIQDGVESTKHMADVYDWDIIVQQWENFFERL